MGREPRRAVRTIAPRFRLLRKLPFEILSPRFGMCRLEYRESTESRNRSIFLVEMERNREWLVHSLNVWDNPVPEFAIYEKCIEIEGPWQMRLFEQLVRDGRAQKVELD